MDILPPVGSEPSSQQYSQEAKEKPRPPSKTTRKTRINNFIKTINDDSLDQVVQDVLTENKRLLREIKTLRESLTSAKKEYEEFVQAILTDRLYNQMGSSDD